MQENVLTDQQKKNARIAATISATRSKRKTQQALVRKVKIIKSKLKPEQKEALYRDFLEAKWLQNTCLAWMNAAPEGEKRYPDEYKRTQDLTRAQVKMPDKTFEDRELNTLGSQMKQGILNRMSENIKGLAAAKKKGRKVGALKFTSKVTSIPLMQLDRTHRIKSAHKIKVQGIPGDLYVRGMEQIPDGADLACSATLLEEGGDYYIAFTFYIDKSDYAHKQFQYEKESPIGIDMGISATITTSDGKKIDSFVEETSRLKKLQRKLSRQEKGSHNYYKTQTLINKEYAKLNNRKDDAAHKAVHELLKHEHVYMQDELLTGWKTKFGKKIQHSILGRVKADLIQHPRVTVLKSSVATTQTCPYCFHKTKHDLSQRTFTCEVCGYTKDRDVHAANNMILLAQASQNIKLGQGLSEFTPEERLTSVVGDANTNSVGDNIVFTTLSKTR